LEDLVIGKDKTFEMRRNGGKFEIEKAEPRAAG
jgi:hypothetical protein